VPGSGTDAVVISSTLKVKRPKWVGSKLMRSAWVKLCVSKSPMKYAFPSDKTTSGAPEFAALLPVLASSEKSPLKIRSPLITYSPKALIGWFNVMVNESPDTKIPSKVFRPK